jgi:hypothetical protein
MHHPHPQFFKHCLASVAAASFAFLLVAAVTCRTATAPEPADLKASSSGATGATGAAGGGQVARQSNVLLWPGAWTPGNAAAGTPCSTYDLAAGDRPTKVIEANGPLRRCH